MGNFRQISRQEWSAADTVESINAGSLQRIADATEAMAKGHVELARERDNYKRWYDSGTAFRNVDGSTMTADAFFAAAANRSVKVRGSWNGAAFNATEVELQGS